MEIFIHPAFLLLSSLIYSYFLVKKFPKGKIRVISLLPVFYIFSLLPWHFSSAFARGISAFFITWITSFKLLLFCFDQGPLIASQTFIDFITLATFPFKLRTSQNPPKPSVNLQTSLKLARTFVLVLILLNMCINNELFPYPPQFKLIVYGLCTSLGFYAAMARYELVPLFKQPYLATSLQDFWGRRWNRMASNILRLTVYEPTRETLTSFNIGARPAKATAMITTLVISGIMHELVFYYISCGRRPSWEVTLFFTLNGLCMILETIARAIGQGDQVKPVVSIPLTVGFVMVTGYRLIVLPVWTSAQSSICQSKTM